MWVENGDDLQNRGVVVEDDAESRPRGCLRKLLETGGWMKVNLILRKCSQNFGYNHIHLSISRLYNTCRRRTCWCPRSVKPRLLNHNLNRFMYLSLLLHITILPRKLVELNPRTCLSISRGEAVNRVERVVLARRRECKRLTSGGRGKEFREVTSEKGLGWWC